MGTPLHSIYDTFTSKILEDEWSAWDEDLVEADMIALLDDAIPYFKFPRQSLEHNNVEFTNNLNSIEIQIISVYMKIEWLNRCILSWQNLKPLYSEQDFSQANLIDKFTKLLSEERKNAQRLESIYYRSINGSPFPYRNLANNG